MTALPTLVDIPAGHVVRVRAAGIFFTSAVMSPGEARELLARIEKDTDHGEGRGFITFTGGDGAHNRIKARAITSIDAGPPRARREDPARTVVHNHFHDGPPIPAAEVVEAEPQHTAGCSCGARGDLDFILEHPCSLEQS